MATLLFVASVLLAFVSFQRLRGRGFATVPRPAGWAAAILAAASLVLAVVLPPIIRPDISALRPASRARLRILSPHPGEVFSGDPAMVPVRIRLIGGEIVPFTSTKLASNRGHVHLFLDGAFVSMRLGLTQEIEVGPGSHRLEAEFVAVDHAPFNPRVRASVVFRVVRRA